MTSLAFVHPGTAVVTFGIVVMVAIVCVIVITLEAIAS